MKLPESEQWAATCAEDGEFKLAARHWDGGLVLRIGTQVLGFTLKNGLACAGIPPDGPAVVEFSGEADVWKRVLAPVPERFHNDLMANIAAQKGISLTGGALPHAQYYAASMRAVELLRAPKPEVESSPQEIGESGRFDSPVGRYVHLNLQGHDHRIYYEEAGRGIPLLLQHTAGCHGSQWRHLFEVPGITDRFRLIAYDLPYHGKSLPPISREWWAETYELEGAFLRSIPLELSSALGLERPVFMGCSVGGLLALDLAARHPEDFRSVISVEGALYVGGQVEDFPTLWHPQVSNEYKARLMDGIMSPHSPKAYRRETSFIYSSAWPPAFLGDLHYYMGEYDLREQAPSIDAEKTGVHILSAEYDWSATVEMGRQAHEAIPGSTFTRMDGVGHFPMSENPEAFIEHLLPILNRIASDGPS